MLNCIECLREIEHKEDDGAFRCFTLVNVFKTPGQTILDRSTTKKTVLIAMYTSQDHFLKPIGQNFSDQLQTIVKERDWTKIIDILRRVNLGDQCDKTCINAFQIKAALMKLLTKKIKIIFNDWPTCF